MELELAFHTNDILDGKQYIFCPTILRKSFSLKKNNIAFIVTMHSEYAQDELDLDVQVLAKNEYDKFIHNHYMQHPKFLIAVTGTNGKTSTAIHIAQILSYKYRTSVLGSLGYKEFEYMKETKQVTTGYYNTTNQLGITLRTINNPNIDKVVLETSSISVNRLGNLTFQIGVFTNFGIDHIVEHNGIDKYFQSKINIMNRCNILIVNSSIKQNLNHPHQIKFGKDISDDYRYDENNILYHNGLSIQLSIHNGLIIENIIPAIIIAHLNGIDLYTAVRITRYFITITGRMMKIGTNIMVDYAHNGAAMQYMIEQYKPDTVVFGCGGDRELSRRKFMTQAALQCPLMIITSDNNRSEQLLDIFNDIIQHLKCNMHDIHNKIALLEQAIVSNIKIHDISNIFNDMVMYITHKNYMFIPDRYRAIETACMVDTEAKVLICGMGDEIYLDALGNKTNDILYASGIVFWKQFIKISNCSLYHISTYTRPGYFMSDTRYCTINSIFVALNGQHSHGHNYLNSSIQSAIVSDVNIFYKFKGIIKNILYIENIMPALIKFGQHMKQNIKNTICITGTCGKTSTTDMVFNILDDVYMGYKNHNTAISIPMCLSSIDHEYTYGVFELGVSHKGDMCKLMNIIQHVNVGIITNIGPGHIGNFDHFDELINEKTTLKADIMIVPYEYAHLYDNVISFGTNKSDIYILHAEYKNGIVHMRINAFNQIIEYTLSTPVHINNSLIAWGLQKIYDIDIELLKVRLHKLCPLEGRGHIIQHNGITFIDDTYNANPMSLQHSIKCMFIYPAKKYIAIIGEMKELGNFDYSSYLNNLNQVDYLLTYGNIDLSYIKSFYKNYQDPDILVTELQLLLEQDSIVMIKGSRSMFMEYILNKCLL